MLNYRIRSRAFPSTSSNVSTATPFLVDRRPPPNLGKWANFKRFIWDRKKGTFCNRTFTGWCKVIFFYLIFLLLINGMFFLFVLGATEYIMDNFKYPVIDKHSLIPGEHPGVSFMPNIIRKESPLLWYSFRNQSLGYMNYLKYVTYINSYFKEYDEAEKHKEDYNDCEVAKHPNKVCIFLKSYLGPCGSGTFGYEDKQPCIYIKMNKLRVWVPEYYTGNDLPAKMPDPLKIVIKAAKDKKKVWVYCKGVNPADDEHMGAVTYYPDQGIKGYYFPYVQDTKYLSPLVAVKIGNIKISEAIFRNASFLEGRVIYIRCSAWAKNIKHACYADIQMYLAMD